MPRGVVLLLGEPDISKLLLGSLLAWKHAREAAFIIIGNQLRKEGRVGGGDGRGRSRGASCFPTGSAAAGTPRWPTRPINSLHGGLACTPPRAHHCHCPAHTQR